MWSAGKYVYDHQFLLDIQNKDLCYEKYLLGAKSAERAWSATPNGAKGDHGLYRSCAGEETSKAVRQEAEAEQARLTVNPYKPSVSTIKLTNVHSLDSKMDYKLPHQCWSVSLFTSTLMHRAANCSFFFCFFSWDLYVFINFLK